MSSPHFAGVLPQLARSIRTLADNPELAHQMGRAGWDLVRQRHSPEEHYSKLFALYEDLVSGERDLSGKLVSAARTSPWKNIPTTSAIRPNLRVAFIGGRGVISKYSGIEFSRRSWSAPAEMGHEVTVYCRNHFTPALSEHQGMHIVRLPTLRSKHLETLLHTLLSTAHALTQKYDVVHYHALGPALFSWIPRLFGTATTLTVQGFDWQRAKWGKTASRRCCNWGNARLCSLPTGQWWFPETLQRHYRQAHTLETVCAPNGGVLRERIEPYKILEWGLEPDGYVLFMGRFSPEKGCHVLIEAFERIETDLKLVLAGGASYCDAYTRDVLSHASDHVRILSWVSGQDLDELLTNAMLFVLPSEMEGLSLALLDAMGAGICVLASDIAENREAVEGAGFTFQCGDVQV